MKIATYDPDDLREMIYQECGDAPFVQTYLAAIARQLEASPADYRDFGPHWWVLKQILQRYGYAQFGDTVDVAEDLLESLVYEDEALTVAAAYAYAEHNFLSGVRHQHIHILRNPSGEPESYLIADPDMEALIVGLQVIRGLRHGALH